MDDGAQHNGSEQPLSDDSRLPHRRAGRRAPDDAAPDGRSAAGGRARVPQRRTARYRRCGPRADVKPRACSENHHVHLCRWAEKSSFLHHPPFLQGSEAETAAERGMRGAAEREMGDLTEAGDAPFGGEVAVDSQVCLSLVQSGQMAPWL